MNEGKRNGIQRIGAAVPAVEVEERERENEFRRLVQWRRAALERAGYEPAAADAIAERVDVDLHVATDLVRDGCPPETALRILL